MKYASLIVGYDPAPSQESIWALQAISLEIKKGEIVGVIGHNGAGKSTLLRLLAGIATPTSGTVNVASNPSTLLDLSAGLQMFLTGRENILTRLDMLGISRGQADSMVGGIVAFAELEQVIDQVLVTYSTGMRMRLAFAIATSVKPEILLIDETLAVGDEFFSAKSFNRIEEMARSGCTCVIVSHDWNKIFRLASRVIWLDGGRMRADGEPSEVLYPFLLSLNAFRVNEKIAIEQIEIVDWQGLPRRSFYSGETVCLSVWYRKAPDIETFAAISGAMVAGTGESVISVFSLDDGVVLGHRDKDYGQFNLAYLNQRLHPGTYDLTLLLSSPEQGAFPYEYHAVWGPMTAADCRIEVIEASHTSRDAPLLSLNPRWEMSL
jgi:ABC-type polysaccharide/polyol phosphate transport system ATPase subunit